MAREQMGSAPSRPADTVDVAYLAAQLATLRELLQHTLGNVTGVDADGNTVPLTVWTGSTDEFAAISPKDPLTVYLVYLTA